MPWPALLALALTLRPDPPGDGLTLAGRVVEAADDRPRDGLRPTADVPPAPDFEPDARPIAGATVVVRRTSPGVDGDESTDETLTTDADGRFAVTIPADRAADGRDSVAVVRVSAPGRVGRRSPGRRPPPVSVLVEERGFGDVPSFGTIALARGVEVTGRLVGPDGRPAAGVPLTLSPGDGPSGGLENDPTGRTDGDGRFLVRVGRSPHLALFAQPDGLANFQRAWELPPPGPDSGIDLGRLELEPGLTLAGRLVDAAGRPRPGRRLVAQGWAEAPARSAVTGEDGRFAFGPLRPGTYAVQGEGWRVFDEPPRADPAEAEVVRPVTVVLRRGEAPGPIEVRQSATVPVEVRFVDPSGAPIPGAVATLAGLDSDPRVGPLQAGSLVELINQGLPPHDPSSWATTGRADRAGRMTFRIPRELFRPIVTPVPSDLRFVYEVRLDDGPPAIGLRTDAWLGRLGPGGIRVEMVRHRAATLLVSIEAEDGVDRSDEALAPRFMDRSGLGGMAFPVRQADGRYRARLVPDRAYEVDAETRFRVQDRALRLTPAEGEVIERSLSVRPRPAGPKVGDLAPPFLVPGLDGPPITLADYQGRYLLLHFWDPKRDDNLRVLRRIVADRADDPRFSVLGLVQTPNAAAFAQIKLPSELTWPLAPLRGLAHDPAVQDYRGDLAHPLPVLIGPDGRVVARAVQTAGGVTDYAPIVDALAPALGPPK